MQNEIEDFNQTLINLYLKNLDFLKSKHINVYEKVMDLSEQIDKEEYKEKYSLEYKTEGYFDILNLETNEFIYGFNSYEEADMRAEQTDFSKNNSLDLLRINPQDKKFALMESLGDVLPLVNFLNNTIDFKNVTFAKIFKFIFIGVGVGAHLNEIYKKIDSMNTMIMEPELEIFRLSLFTTDYTVFEEGNKKLFLSVGENEVERELSLTEFTVYHNYMNYNIKHHLFWINYKDILDEIINYYSHNHAASFSYAVILQVLSRTVKFMKEKKKFLKNDFVMEHTPLQNKKVLIVSAGPSVDDHLDWIKENQDKFIIVCVDVILKKLEKNNITPDIVVSIDPSYLCGEYLTTEKKDFLKDSAIIFLSQQEDSVLEKVKHVNYYFSQVFPIAKELGYSFSLPNVGTFSFAMSIFLNANELYLIGNDAAFHQETGSRYASDSAQDLTDLSVDSSDTLDENIISGYDIVETKGNLREKIKSNRTLLTFKRDYESFIHGLDEKTRDSIKAYNLSDGAYIEGLIPLNLEEIDTTKLEQKKFNAKEILDQVSCEVKELEFDDDLRVLTSIIKRINKFKKVKVSSRNDFLEKKLDLMIWILEQKKHMSTGIFGNVFLKYIELVDIYINFSLNLKQDNLYSSENLMKIKQYWCESSIPVIKSLKNLINQE